MFNKKREKMSWIETLGQQAGNNIVGAGMGMILGEYNDRRQREQQEALMQMQMRGQKEMTDYNMAKQLQMWKDTNYSAQVEQMNKAGINPALLYGKGGAGGATTGQASGSVQGAMAPTGGREVMDMSNLMLQQQLQKSQIQVMEAQADKLKADADKTRGVDTEATKAGIERTWQGLANDRNEFDLQNLERTMRNIENFEKQASQKNRMQYIAYQTKLAEQELRSATAGGDVDQATIDSRIKIIRTEAVGAVLKNMLTEAQTFNTKTNTLATQQQMSNAAEKLLIDWDRLSIDKQELRIKEALKEWNTDPNREAVKAGLGIINGIISRGMMPPPGDKYIEYHRNYNY